VELERAFWCWFVLSNGAGMNSGPLVDAKSEFQRAVYVLIHYIGSDVTEFRRLALNINLSLNWNSS
jgi:hypothetical protein